MSLPHTPGDHGAAILTVGAPLAVPLTTSLSSLQPSLGVKLISAGVGGCIAELATLPLDTAKVRLQVRNAIAPAWAKSMRLLINGDFIHLSNLPAKPPGMVHTLRLICIHEGPKAMYSGLAPGLQRQMCFATIRIGFYDDMKKFYQQLLQTAPTTKRYTTDYWSSWSSWSSDSDYNKSSSGLGTWAVVGIVVGVIGVIGVCLMCIICCNAKAKKPDPRYSTAAVQYQAATPRYNCPPQIEGAAGTSLLPQCNQSNQQNTKRQSTPPLIYTPAISNQYPGYQIHPPVYESASPYKGTQQMSNIVPSAPP